MLNFFRLIRLPNLFIVALTQSIIYFHILLPHFEQQGIKPALPLLPFLLFILTTVLITAGGYIINDILDYETDLINKGENIILHKRISVQVATWLYLTVGAGGFFVAIYLAFYIGQLDLVVLYPIAIGGLFMYSRYFKKMPLLGNLFVAVFSAGVAGIVGFAEMGSLEKLTQIAPQISWKLYAVLGVYMLFAFYTSLFRELVKDIEDIKGDSLQHHRTLPILLGIPKVKKLAMLFGISLLFLMITAGWIAWDIFIPVVKYVLSPLLILLLIWILIRLFKADKKSDFHQVSQLTKFVMLGGILILLGLNI